MSYEGYEYPTDEELERIAKWKIDWEDDGKFPLYAPWFDYIKALWWMPDWGWAEFDGNDDIDGPCHCYHISTGGWSGNESLLSAMRENWINYGQTFYIHKRGGHYEFRIRRRSEKPQSADAVDPHAGSTGTPSPRDGSSLFSAGSNRSALTPEGGA